LTSRQISTLRRTLAGLRGEGRGWTLLVVAGCWLLIQGFRVMLPVLLPQIKADFAVSNASAGFALTVLWLMYGGMQFPSGIAADRLGERRLLVTSASLAALSFVAFFLAPVFLVFLVACFLFGLGSGMYGTARDMVLSRTYPAADSTAYGITFAAGSLGAATLPGAATYVSNGWGWRPAVATMLPLFGLLAAGLFLCIPSTGDDDAGPGPVETVRRTVGALTDRSILVASGVMFPIVFTYQAMMAFLPTYLVEIKDLDNGYVAVLFGSVFVFGGVIQALSGHIADRYGEYRTVLALMLLSALTLVVVPFARGPVVLGVLVPLLGVRLAVGPLTSAFIVRKLPEPIKGTGWGFLRTLVFTVGATGSTVIGIFADADLFDAGFLVLAGLTAVAVVFWLALPRADRV